MDSTGFLSPKANAFSIAHLIDASQLSELFNVSKEGSIFGWDSQSFTRDMEGKWGLRSAVFFDLFTLKVWNVKVGVAIDFGMIGIRIADLVYQ